MSLLEGAEGRLAVALGIGLVLGAERERRKLDGPRRLPAGPEHHDDVADPADLVPERVEDGQPGEPGHEHPGRGAAHHGRAATCAVTSSG